MGRSGNEPKDIEKGSVKILVYQHQDRNSNPDSQVVKPRAAFPVHQSTYLSGQALILHFSRVLGTAIRLCVVSLRGEI